VENIVERLRHWSHGLTYDPAAGLMHEAANEIERLRAERGWIPVSERLPPLMTEVLGWHPADRVRSWFRFSGTVQGGPCRGTYWEGWSTQDRECDDCFVDEPTHWMPLPEPPESR
jgi:Protein of unknown function (DUF551)